MYTVHAFESCPLHMWWCCITVLLAAATADAAAVTAGAAAATAVAVMELQGIKLSSIGTCMLCTHLSHHHRVPCVTLSLPLTCGHNNIMRPSRSERATFWLWTMVPPGQAVCQQSQLVHAVFSFSLSWGPCLVLSSFLSNLTASFCLNSCNAIERS